MDLRPASSLADPVEKAKCKRDAKDMFQAIVKYAEKANATVPPYEFLELIGKGAFGRVYKCLDKRNGELVAIKMINIDAQDYEGHWAQKNDNITALNKEISLMKTLKDNKAKNVLLIHEAFDLGPHVWIVSDYCTGGSVRTLQSALSIIPLAKGLEERFIIPIARELAVAVKELHCLSVIHRDIKCGNVYINEDGEIRLGDFGIVGILEDNTSKRKTVIGTPHWLPKEIVEAIATNGEVQEAYGTEIDIWSYGCTVYEMATGTAPYGNTGGDFRALAASLEDAAPRLEGEQHSSGLKDLVAFCLNSDPKARPSIDAVLQHPYILGTEEQFPTSNLISLIDKFKIWMFGGGSRSSLWFPTDADAGLVTTGEEMSEEETDEMWNFSTSDDFDKKFETRYSQMYLSETGSPGFEAPAGAGLPPIRTQDLPMAERVRREHADLSANRGEKSLDRLFNPDTPGYSYTPVDEPGIATDLPLRNFTQDAPSRESVLTIDLDEAESGESALSGFSFHDSTLKAPPRRPYFDDDDDEEEDHFAIGLGNSDERRDTREWTFPARTDRNTREWKFPSQTTEASNRKTMEWTFGTAGRSRLGAEEPLDDFGFESDTGSSSRPTLSRTATEPSGHFRDFSFTARSPPNSAPIHDRESVTSMIDLDHGLADPSEIERPMTANSAAASIMTDSTSGNPFELEEDPEQNERDRQRFLYHRELKAEENRRKRLSRRPRASTHNHSSDSDREQLASHAALGLNFENGFDHSDATGYPTPEHSAYSPTLNDVPRLGDPRLPSNRGRQQGPGSTSAAIRQPNPQAMVEDADPALLEKEFARTLDDFQYALDDLAGAFRRIIDIDEDDEEFELTSDLDSGFDSV